LKKTRDICHKSLQRREKRSQGMGTTEGQAGQPERDLDSLNGLTASGRTVVLAQTVTASPENNFMQKHSLWGTEVWDGYGSQRKKDGKQGE